jgi:acid phosphatase type 7
VRRGSMQGVRYLRAWFAVATVLLAATLTGIGLAALANGSGPAVTTPTLPPGSTTLGPKLAAAGDIACDPKDPRFAQGQSRAGACQMGPTGELLEGGGFSAVLALGDVQYGDGGIADYRASYAPSWGRVKAITHPVLGDGDYHNQNAAGYFRYFGAAAGPSNRGYYSFDLGSWHVIVLNTNCSRVGGCQAGSPQERWLRADLAKSSAKCTLAAWHLPRFGSNAVRVDSTSLPFWRDLYDAGAELVLNGNNHFYERFGPQDPGGKADPARGIREFIVGTGGRSHEPLDAPLANSEARDDRTFGVLELTLRPDGYDWRFVPAAGSAFTDSGSGTCH